MSKDVFISYSTEDQSFAEEVCEFLERAGIACWIAPRDVIPGAVFDEAILDAIESTEAMILILSSNANSSPFVKNEVNRAFANGKTIFTFRMQDVRPSKSLEFYLARHQWTDGFPFPLTEKVQRLAVAVLALLGRPSPFQPVSLCAQPSPGAVDHIPTLSPDQPTAAKLQTLATTSKAEVKLTTQQPQTNSPETLSPNPSEFAIAPLSASEEAPVVAKAIVTHEQPPTEQATDEARVAVRQAIQRIVLEVLNSIIVSNDNTARIWPELARGQMESIVPAILEVLDDPKAKAGDHWRAIALLEFAIRTPVGRAAVSRIAEHVARHLTDDDFVRYKAKQFVCAAPLPSGQKWELTSKFLPTASGRKLSDLIELADKFCPIPEREQLYDAMLEVLEFEGSQGGAYTLGLASRILEKGRHTNGFSRLRSILCFANLDKAFHVSRLLSELGDLGAGPAIREAITNHRHTDSANVSGLLKSLYLVEQTDAVPLISEILLNAGRKCQVYFFYECIGCEEERLREVAKQLMATTSDEELRNAGAKFLAKR